MKNEPAEVRQMAGLLLKNNVKDSYGKMPPEVQNYIKMQILGCLADPQVNVRRTVATIVTTILLRGGVASWPKLLEVLKEGLETNDENCIDGAFYTMTLICEDHNYDLDSADLGRPLNTLIPIFLKFFNASSETFRRYAIQCLNQFVTALPGALLTNMENFIKVRLKSFLRDVRDCFFSPMTQVLMFKNLCVVLWLN
jgi:transportin-1